MARSEIVYSAQKTGYLKGHRYANARLFVEPANGVESIVVVGKWPEIVNAYRMAGTGVRIAQVERAEDLPKFFEQRAKAPLTEPASAPVKFATAAPDEVVIITPPQPKDDKTSIALPTVEELPTLAWPALRTIASQVSGKPITGRMDAEAAIEAERKRRASLPKSEDKGA